eukprot:CAMPEP_0185036456 /NCGR_PEP_ID=MMETSP1103-20130426/29489_1 /TAXON_ID=36769 /ORGANISM="Paraphysomonas bandaiensis, Strain Caron Lab Isolate" /LENGTH=526 /DNA_ID=CAMNT_0027573997 /DNA_START=90 /DNA_END=1667 /DNA_ORIENTATION=-
MEVLTGLYGLIKGDANKAKMKAREEKVAKKMIVLRQKQIEQFEVNQTWNFVYGTIKPKKKKDLLQIKNITYRNIWMEKNFIYDQIVALNPSERFHSPDKYTLQWQPPDSAFQLLIPLDNPQIQAEALRKMQSLIPKIRDQIVFHLTPIRRDMDLYGPKIHPSASESYHDKASVLRKLCEKYMCGTMELDDLAGVLEAGYSTWKVALFNMLTSEEQEFHRYLLKPPPKVIKKSLERQYLDDDINLQEYEDLKFPARKAKRDEEAMTYPRPYSYGQCVICRQNDSATIKCLHCTNLVCTACIQRVFLDENTSEGSFLLLHRRYCTRFGKLPHIELATVPEPAYLRELLATGRLAATKHLDDLEDIRLNGREGEDIESGDEKDDAIEEESDDDISEDTNMDKPDNMPKIMHLVRALSNCTHKIQHSLPLLQEYQEVLDNPRRSSHLRERMQRLREERLERLSRVQNKMKIVLTAMEKYSTVDDVVQAKKEAILERDRLNRFIESESVQAFKDGESRIQEAAAAKEKSDM